MMKTENESKKISSAINNIYPDMSQPSQVLYTVNQFAKAQPAFSCASLRNLIFKADTRLSTRGEIAGNGLIECGAIIRIGRKILIHGDKFLEWVQQNGGR